MIENFQPSEELRENMRALREASVKRVFASLYDVSVIPVATNRSL